MDNDDVIRQFRRIYPESEIRIGNIKHINQKAVITTYFPDGTFFFIISENSVSQSYYSEADAIKDCL